VTTLRSTGLTISAGTRVLVQDLSFSVGSGEFLAVLGRNGCGKSLTLHALAGLSNPRHGRIYLDDVDLRGLSRRHIAQRLGLLPQDREESLSMSALESVMIGRHPHLPFWQREGARDLAIAQSALERLGSRIARGHDALGRGAAAHGDGGTAGPAAADLSAR